MLPDVGMLHRTCRQEEHRTRRCADRDTGVCPASQMASARDLPAPDHFFDPRRSDLQRGIILLQAENKNCVKNVRSISKPHEQKSTCIHQQLKCSDKMELEFKKRQ